MKGTSNFGTLKSSVEVTGNSTEPLQERRMHNWGRDICLYCKKPHKTGDKKICEEYTIEATIQKKMRLYKCDTYIAKETLGYRGGQEEKKTHKK